MMRQEVSERFITGCQGLEVFKEVGWFFKDNSKVNKGK